MRRKEWNYSWKTHLIIGILLLTFCPFLFQHLTDFENAHGSAVHMNKIVLAVYNLGGKGLSGKLLVCGLCFAVAIGELVTAARKRRMA